MHWCSCSHANAANTPVKIAAAVDELAKPAIALRVEAFKLLHVSLHARLHKQFQWVMYKNKSLHFKLCSKNGNRTLLCKANCQFSREWIINIGTQICVKTSSYVTFYASYSNYNALVIWKISYIHCYAKPTKRAFINTLMLLLNET